MVISWSVEYCQQLSICLNLSCDVFVDFRAGKIAFRCNFGTS